MVILTFLIFRGVAAAPPGASPCAAAGCAGGVHGVWGPRVAGLVGAGGVRRCVALRASSRSTARSEEKCARKALATESGTPYARNNFRAKMSEIRSMAPKWIWCASKLSRALDAKATSRSRAGGCWPAVERTPMPHSTRRLFRCQGPKLPFSTVAVHELGQLHEAYKHLRSSRHGSCGRLKTLCGAARERRALSRGSIRYWYRGTATERYRERPPWHGAQPPQRCQAGPQDGPHKALVATQLNSSTSTAHKRTPRVHTLLATTCN